jgi:hypothetical protein
MSLNCDHKQAYWLITQMIYEREKPWWNDVDRGNLIPPPELSKSG